MEKLRLCKSHSLFCCCYRQWLMFAGPLFEDDGFPEADEAEGATWLEFAELELA